MTTNQWINLIVLLLVFGLPAIGHIAKKMVEKREELKRRQAVEVAKREALRTGQVQVQAQPTGSGGGQATAEAARKQAQLQEMRRRQQERLRQAAQQRQRGSVPTPGQQTGQQTGQPTAQQRPGQPSIRTQTPIQTQQRQIPQTVARGPTRPTQQPARPTQQPARPTQQPGRPPQPRPTSRVDAPAAPREDLRARLERREREADAAKIATQQRRNEGRTVQRRPDRPSVHDTAWEKRRPSRTSVHEGAWEKDRDDTFSWDAVEQQGMAHLLGRKMSPEDWRSAVIMQEVLARPLAMRGQNEQGIL